MSADAILSRLNQPFNPIESLARVYKLRSMQLANQTDQQNVRLNQAKLDEIARANQERQQLDEALRSGVTTTRQSFTPDPGNILSPTVEGPATSSIDNAKVVSS